MLLPINWHTYAVACLVILGVYYTVVVLLYYRDKIIPVPKSTKSRTSERSDTVSSSLFQEEKDKAFHQPNQLAAVDLSPMVQNLVDELDAFLFQAAAEKADKETIFKGINNLLKRYPALKGSDYENGINNLIDLASETHCNIRFNAGEQMAFWK